MAKKKELVKVICPTHKRAGKVKTHKRIANLTLTCEERQVPAYTAAYPDVPIEPHPDDLDLMQTWQWVMDKWPGHFWIDDDLLGIYRVYRRPGAWKRAVLSPDRAYELIQRTAETAERLGAYLFGWGKHAHPLTFNGLKPFRLGGYSPGGAYGLLPGHKIYASDDPAIAMASDHWLCLLNAYHHRYAWYDCRFAAGFDATYIGVGGASEERGKLVDGEPAEVTSTRASAGDVRHCDPRLELHAAEPDQEHPQPRPPPDRPPVQDLASAVTRRVAGWQSS